MTQSSNSKKKTKPQAVRRFNPGTPGAWTSLVYLLAPSMTRLLRVCIAHSITYSLAQSLNLSLPCLIAYSLKDSLARSLTHLFPCPLSHSLVHPVTHEVLPPTNTKFVTCATVRIGFCSNSRCQCKISSKHVGSGNVSNASF